MQQVTINGQVFDTYRRHELTPEQLDDVGSPYKHIVVKEDAEDTPDDVFIDTRFPNKQLVVAALGSFDADYNEEHIRETLQSNGGARLRMAMTDDVPLVTPDGVLHWFGEIVVTALRSIMRELGELPDELEQDK